jgi:hypothetical protein
VTFQLHTYYCTRCRTATPHELSEDGQSARCVTCTATQRALQIEQQQFSPTNRHLAALDGMGNRGERPPTAPIMKGETT